MRRLLVIACLFVGLLVPFMSVHAASGYANPAFAAQWQQGEAITPNFWGPLSLAKESQQESYKEASGGKRLVQYFDKGRMELTNGVVTNGLLASDMVRGRVQVGDNAFENRPAPAIAMAGDANGGAPTYADLATTASTALAPTANRTGKFAGGGIIAGKYIEVAAPASYTGQDAATDTTYDAPTQHNVTGSFAAYRTRTGLTTIGYAISEPFVAEFNVAGVRSDVVIQVFERRVSSPLRRPMRLPSKSRWAISASTIINGGMALRRQHQHHLPQFLHLSPCPPRPRSPVPRRHPPGQYSPIQWDGSVFGILLTGVPIRH